MNKYINPTLATSLDKENYFELRNVQYQPMLYGAITMKILPPKYITDRIVTLKAHGDKNNESLRNDELHIVRYT